MQARDMAWTRVREMFTTDDPAHRYRLADFPAADASGETKVSVVRADSVVAGYPYKDPLVLVFADDVTPGGCVHAGAGMQEESIFRRTSIHRSLLPEMYPLRDDECLYCPDLPVVFDSEANEHAPLTDVHASFVACACVKFPRLVEGNSKLRHPDARLVADKIRMLLALAARHGHDCLVLGAWGCGAYGCPPRHIADIMFDVVGRHSRISNVVFACPGSAYGVFVDAQSRAATASETNSDGCA